ncbi:MAG: hypothetical protein JWO73_694 [Candidatus Taylorbacteria bacterium]|nr:hypothetical protein [Candidatus Taylorbacteria bacterium]
MFYLDIIVIIGVIWAIVSQNGRISQLEKKFKIMSEKPAEPAEQVSAAQPVSFPDVPMYAAAAAAPAADAVEPAPRITNEEASGRFLGKLGIAAVLIGIAFFLKYAFENNWIGPVGRVMIGIIAGLGFLGTGQFLRAKYLKYSDLLMGGGIAILYLSVYSAHSFYHLIDPFTTGVFMFVVTLLSFAISIVNATQTLALVGIIGGFATPFLVASGSNEMLTLFFYLTILNLGVLGVSFFKKWPRLIAVAFAGNAICFMAWFANYYTKAELGPTLAFIFVSFLIFLAASVARVIITGRMAEKLKADDGDYFLLGLNAAASALMMYILLNPDHHAILGFVSVLLAIIYCVVAFIANKCNPGDKALNIFLPGLAVVFLSIAVPMQFSGPWIAVAWLVESVFLYIIASFISNRGFQVMGVIVYFLGIFDFIVWSSSKSISETFVPIMNTSFAILALAVIAAYAIAFMYKRFGSTTVEIQKRGIIVFVIAANILTIFAFTTQVTSFHKAKNISLAKQYQSESIKSEQYNSGYDTSGVRSEISKKYYEETSSNNNRSNTLVSILWAAYAALLTAIGFMRRIAAVRRLGLVLFVLTALKVLFDVWSLGEIYRIVSFIVFGLIALIASFAYAKYKDRLKEIV